MVFVESNIDELFKVMSDRFQSENDFSDIFSAILRSNRKLSLHFLSGFFKLDFHRDEMIEITREYHIDQKNRVDFRFNIGNFIFLLENKLWDTDYHIESYTSAVKMNHVLDENGFKIVKLGLIVNHSIDSHSHRLANKRGWVVRTWTDWEESLQLFKKDLNDPILDGFHFYLRSVCMMKEMKRITWNNEALLSIFYFNNLIESIIRNGTVHNQFEFGYYAAQRSTGHAWSGHYYTLKYTVNSKSVWPFFGIVYHPNPRIVINLDSDWHDKSLLEKFKMDTLSNSPYEFVKDHDGVGFFLKNEIFKKFSISDKQEQKQLLTAFFNFVNQKIAEVIKKI